MLELNKIHLGDSYELIKQIPDKSIDLVLIDPPYLMDKRGTAFHKKEDYIDEIQNNDLNDDFDYSILDEIRKKMKLLNLYVFCSKNQLSKLFCYFINDNIDLLVWFKHNPIPTVNNKYLSDLEYIIFIREKGVQLNGDYSTLSKMYQSNVNKDDKDHFEHPTIKPLSLIKNFIINSSNENDIVLDCFSGSGTTCVAAKELNRRFIGIEIDPHYHKISVDRLNGISANGQTSIFTDFTQENEIVITP